MIPKIAAVRPRRRHGVGRAHILDGRVPHVLLLELFTDAGIGTMVTERPERRLDVASMPTYAPPPVTFVRGAGTELWDADGQALPRLPRAAWRSRPRPRPPRGRRRRSPSRPGRCCTCRTCSAPTVGRRWRPRSTASSAAGGQVFFCNSGAEANECAIKLARKFGGRGRHVVVSAFGTLPRPHARHPPRHRPAGQARAVPAAARGVPPRRLGRHRRPRAPPSTRRSPPCCSSRCRARAA